jgi:hypothetical protein
MHNLKGAFSIQLMEVKFIISQREEDFGLCLPGEEKRKKSPMKSKIAFGTLALSLLLGSSAIAGPQAKGSLNLMETVTVGEKQLAPGKYQLEWTGTGSSVELSIAKGKEIIAKIPAKLVTEGRAQRASGYSTNSEKDGSTSLTSIFFEGKNYELDLHEASAAALGSQDSAQGRN